MTINLCCRQYKYSLLVNELMSLHLALNNFPQILPVFYIVNIIYFWIKTIIRCRWGFNTLIRPSFWFTCYNFISIIHRFKVFTDWLKNYYTIYLFHHLQNGFYHGNDLNQTLEVSLFYLVELLMLLILLMLLSFLYKSGVSMNLEMSDLSTKPLFLSLCWVFYLQTCCSQIWWNI